MKTWFNKRFVFVVLFLVLASIPIGISFGKYVWSGDAAKFDLDIKGKYCILETGTEFNNHLSAADSYAGRDIYFGTYDDYPNATRGKFVANVDKDHTGTIKMYYYSSRIYVLAEKQIYANPDCSHMFKGREAKIYYKNFDTTLTTNMAYMFSGCNSSVEPLDFSKYDTSNVTNMSHMFYNTYIRSLDLSSFDTSNVRDMSYMFANGQYMSSYLKSINISSFKTSNVTNMAGLFARCSKLENVDLTTFDTSNVTNMSYMFELCDGIDTFDISTLNTAKVTNMSYMFSNIDTITEIDLHHLSNASCSNYTGMFWSCNKLRSIHICGFVSKDRASIGNMFTDYSNSETDPLYIYVQKGMSLAKTGKNWSEVNLGTYIKGVLGTESNYWDSHMKAGDAFWVCSKHTGTQSLTNSVNVNVDSAYGFGVDPAA